MRKTNNRFPQVDNHYLLLMAPSPPRHIHFVIAQEFLNYVNFPPFCPGLKFFFSFFNVLLTYHLYLSVLLYPLPSPICYFSFSYLAENK